MCAYEGLRERRGVKAADTLVLVKESTSETESQSEHGEKSDVVQGDGLRGNG